MNFGDILDKWEKTKSGVSSDKTMEKWLANNKAYDKEANEDKFSAPGKNRSRLLRKPPDDTLDIHGFSDEQAWQSLSDFFSKAKTCGFEKLRIIHGKGNHSQGEAILKRTVRRFIEQYPFAGASGHENAANGGAGATWVLLK